MAERRSALSGLGEQGLGLREGVFWSCTCEDKACFILDFELFIQPRSLASVMANPRESIQLVLGYNSLISLPLLEFGTCKSISSFIRYQPTRLHQPITLISMESGLLEFLRRASATLGHPFDPEMPTLEPLPYTPNTIGS